MQVKKIKKVRVYEEIVEQLKDIIESGELQVGERLPSERELAEQFAVSRVSIRQALTVLETVGLIERKIGGGTYTISPNDDAIKRKLSQIKSSIFEPMEVRMMLEPQIAMLAAKRANEDNIKEIEFYIKEQEKKIAAEQLITDEDGKMHMAIARATNNTIVISLLETINEMVWETRKNSISAEGGSQRSLEGHKEILEAIKNHDQDAAYEAMKKHLISVEELIMSGIEKQTKKNN